MVRAARRAGPHEGDMAFCSDRSASRHGRVEPGVSRLIQDERHGGESRGFGIERVWGLQRSFRRAATEYQHQRDRSVHVSRESDCALRGVLGDGELHPGGSFLAALPAESELDLYISKRTHREARVSVHYAWFRSGQCKLVQITGHAAGRLVTD